MICKTFTHAVSFNPHTSSMYRKTIANTLLMHAICLACTEILCTSLLIHCSNNAFFVGTYPPLQKQE